MDDLWTFMEKKRTQIARITRIQTARLLISSRNYQELTVRFVADPLTKWEIVLHLTVFSLAIK